MDSSLIEVQPSVRDMVGKDVQLVHLLLKKRENIQLKPLLDHLWHKWTERNLTLENYKASPELLAWAAILRASKAPTHIECSLKHLTKNALRHAVNPITPMVDLQRYLSLAYGLSGGVSDADKLTFPLRLRMSKKETEVQCFNASKHTVPLHAPSLYSGEDVVVSWMVYRESAKTMLTETTTNFLLMLNVIDYTEQQKQDLVEELKRLLTPYFVIDKSGFSA